MCMGEHPHSVEEKSRLIIPDKFRGDIGRIFVATRGLDKCLFLYPLAEWNFPLCH